MNSIKLNNLKKNPTFCLSAVHCVIKNLPLNKEMFSILESQGFSKAMFEHGKELYKSASETISSVIIYEERYKETEDQLTDLQKAIHQTYSEFTLFAKKCSGKELLNVLEINGTPRSNYSSCEKAKTTFYKIRDNEQFKTHLIKHGYSDEQLQTSCSLINRWDCTAKLSFDLQLALDQANYSRQIAVTKLIDWLHQFSIAAVSAMDECPALPALIEIDESDLHSFAELDNSNTPFAKTQPIKVNM